MKHLLFYTTALCTSVALAHNAFAESCGGDCTYHIEGTKLVIDSGSEIPMSAFDAWEYPEFKSITEVFIPSTIETIGDFAFEATPLTSITLPEGLTSIGYLAFYNTQLTSITIPGSVTSIGGEAFRYTPLTSITIPDSVTSIGMDVFRNSDLSEVFCSKEKVGTGVCVASNFNGIEPGYFEDKDGQRNFYSATGEFIRAEALSAQDDASTLAKKYHGTPLLYGKKIYTVQEAMEATKDDTKFHVGLTYK